MEGRLPIAVARSEQLDQEGCDAGVKETARLKKTRHVRMLKSHAIQCMSGETNKQSSHHFSQSWLMLVHHLALTSTLMTPAAGALMSFAHIYECQPSNGKMKDSCSA